MKLDAPKPPRGKGRLQAVAPAPDVAPDNLSKSTEGMKDLGFKVPESFHREYKSVAVAWGMPMVDILRASFEMWVEKNGRFPQR